MSFWNDLNFTNVGAWHSLMSNFFNFLATITPFLSQKEVRMLEGYDSIYEKDPRASQEAYSGIVYDSRGRYDSKSTENAFKTSLADFLKNNLKPITNFVDVIKILKDVLGYLTTVFPGTDLESYLYYICVNALEYVGENMYRNTS